MKKLKKKICTGDKLIVSFMHSNFFIASGGTENFAKSYFEILQRNGFNYISFFPVRFPGLKDKKLTGVIFNDEFLGVFSYSEMGNIIDEVVCRFNLSLIAIQIQHLLNHDLKKVEEIILRCGVPVFYFIHDFYSVCWQLNMISSSGFFCGVSEPNQSKCKECRYQEKGVSHSKAMRQFLRQISPFLANIIVPSEYVAEALGVVFSEYRERIIVRPHLKFTGNKIYPPLKDKINIAFIGAPAAHKGFEEWKKLVRLLYPGFEDSYSFFCLSAASQRMNGVKNIHVSIARQGKDAMVKTLEKNLISCAFIWPRWGETYSYVYYEAAVNGVFVVSNPWSGNIASEIRRNKNGIIFDSFNECAAWFQKPREVLSEINRYRCAPHFAPQSMSPNESIDELLSLNDSIRYTVKGLKEEGTSALFLETFFYKLVYQWGLGPLLRPIWRFYRRIRSLN